MFKLFKMCLVQASLAGVLLGLGAAGCSHRNIKEEGPARPRHLLSAVTTEDHLFVVTNQNEFYRTDLNVKNFEPLSLPSVGPSILPPALYAAGPHLYLMDQHLAYSPDEGQSWKALPLPQPRRNYACFDVDQQGQRLLAYGDSLWYGKTPDEDFVSLGFDGVVDCRVMGSLFLIARGGVTEIRSLTQPTLVLASLPGYWLTQKSGDGQSLFIVSSKDQKIYRFQDGSLDASNISFPKEPILSLAALASKVAILTSKQVLVYENDRETLMAASDAKERFLIINAQNTILAHDQGLEVLRKNGVKELLLLPTP
ncbi:MAG: hypothetical protein ACOVS5_10765 [Oligoflexus sp.]|jgi:hypothetical protein